jgi:hypothetical protein
MLPNKALQVMPVRRAKFYLHGAALSQVMSHAA